MYEVKAPNGYERCPRPWVFLCGSIEMGSAEQWQARLAGLLARKQGTLLNPRRSDWDSSWEESISNPQFREQVEWALEAQERANVLAVYFDPATKSPVTLLELGLFQEKCVVCCPEGYWRKGNVDIVCARLDIPTATSLDDLARIITEEEPQ